VALISVDGKPARYFRIGSVVEAGLVLKAVSARSVELSPSVGAPASFKLELPLPR
jgi:general secretion pathway protein C